LKIIPSQISGCYEIFPHIHRDLRGAFIKTFHAPTFEEFGLCSLFLEEYYSISVKNVVRGLHFQLPPEDHVKLVYCISGVVKDVVVDLRLNSPTYGDHISIELSADTGNMVYIPKGMAHGFCGLSDHSTMVYKTSTIHSPEKDSGIRWNSLGISWPTSAPIVSDRDSSLIPFSMFKTPFTFSQ
jgi:dTDP-4-dehydrorhamnose 3,5-epimerase